jgi:hypothetical protein
VDPQIQTLGVAKFNLRNKDASAFKKWSKISKIVGKPWRIYKSHGKCILPMQVNLHNFKFRSRRIGPRVANKIRAVCKWAFKKWDRECGQPTSRKKTVSAMTLIGSSVPSDAQRSLSTDRAQIFSLSFSFSSSWNRFYDFFTKPFRSKFKDKHYLDPILRSRVTTPAL